MNLPLFLAPHFVQSPFVARNLRNSRPRSLDAARHLSQTRWELDPLPPQDAHLCLNLADLRMIAFFALYLARHFSQGITPPQRLHSPSLAHLMRLAFWASVWASEQTPHHFRLGMASLERHMPQIPSLVWAV